MTYHNESRKYTVYRNHSLDELKAQLKRPMRQTRAGVAPHSGQLSLTASVSLLCDADIRAVTYEQSRCWCTIKICCFRWTVTILPLPTLWTITQSLTLNQQQLFCFKKKQWTGRESNSGPSACEADVIPLHHRPFQNHCQSQWSESLMSPSQSKHFANTSGHTANP